ncbi:cation:proton antiporter [Streptomyces panaciradicis]|uniref:cation:proton antiporter n=1 Tax=Streptomyces panaciradicis TaxID=1470261 RepID=UPI00201CE453|nr:cation:proton antiporter [Streptomyces panaciradicis]MCL6675146.1 sodium:proton exchanger [Streptomyces panaciradicis]
MTTDDILFGVGLTFVLAVGSQLAAARARVPALIILLPAGFIAGALTDDIHPDQLLGPAFGPLVSLSVALILYEAGLGLDPRTLGGNTRRTVVRLIVLGVALSWVTVALLAGPLLGMSGESAVMLGAILVVSGPTVVGPLLAFVRPADRLQTVLSWEGSLVDPVGAILGALVFAAVLDSGHNKSVGYQVVQFLISVGVGLAGAVVGSALLWLLLTRFRPGGALGTTGQLATVVAVAAVCDIVRDDTGLIAAIVMGLAVARLPGVDMPEQHPFSETLVQLIIGLLFVSISSTVTPASLRHVVLPTLGIVAILVLITRPLAVWLATLGAGLTRGERGFVAWMAPRGIVAAANASTFSVGLVSAGVDGASKILPVTFLTIAATVTLYGLTAVPVARRLGVTRPSRSRPLLVGGDPWAIDLGRTLQSAGLEVLMWAGSEEQRACIRQAGLELAPGELLAAATGDGSRLEGITTVLLLTDEDDFNALASMVLSNDEGVSVFRLGPRSSDHGVVALSGRGETLLAPALTRLGVAQRYAQGARIETQHVESADGTLAAGHDLLLLIRPGGRLVPADGTDARISPQPGDIAVLLGQAPDPRADRPQAPGSASP